MRVVQCCIVLLCFCMNAIEVLCTGQNPFNDSNAAFNSQQISRTSKGFQLSGRKAPRRNFIWPKILPYIAPILLIQMVYNFTELWIRGWIFKIRRLLGKIQYLWFDYQASYMKVIMLGYSKSFDGMKITSFVTLMRHPIHISLHFSRYSRRGCQSYKLYYLEQFQTQLYLTNHE